MVYYKLFFACSFVVTNNRQTGVTLKKKFNNWEYSWWKSLNKRMPWVVASGSNNMSLLTTSDSPTYYPSGSILWEGKDRHPADWIWDGGMRDPGVIWYWVNEDDCDANRQPGNKSRHSAHQEHYSWTAFFTKHIWN